MRNFVDVSSGDGLRWKSLSISQGLRVTCFWTLEHVVCRENRQQQLKTLTIADEGSSLQLTSASI
jgi:hypothetical protein